MTDRTPCDSCSAPSILFICPRCTEEMKAQLISLVRGPEVNGKRTTGLLDACEDVALKRTRLGGGGGHRKRGDEMPGLFIPDVDKTDKDGNTVPSPQGRAATLLTDARNKLTTVARDICESRGVDVLNAFKVVLSDFVGPLMPGWRRVAINWHPSSSEVALWLARHVHAIACDESAGHVRNEVDNLVRSIERAVDRPTRRIWLGDCPTWNETEQRICGLNLWAREDAAEVTCPRCRQSHDCKRLQLLQYSDLDRKKVPWESILRANKSQPEDRQIPERTLQSWRKEGKDGKPPRLQVRAWMRPDGRVAPVRHNEDDVPLYMWPDVRKLRDEKPQKGVTGAAARVRAMN